MVVIGLNKQERRSEAGSQKRKKANRNRKQGKPNETEQNG
jgi:hypothetical protein